MVTKNAVQQGDLRLLKDLGPVGSGTKGPLDRDFGVVVSATEAPMAGFVRLYRPHRPSGRIGLKAGGGGCDEIRKTHNAW